MGIWKSIGRVVGYPLLHPQRTARGMGQALQATGKTTSRVVVGAGAGYVGWEKLTTDKSLTRIVGDAVIGIGGTGPAAGPVGIGFRDGAGQLVVIGVAGAGALGTAGTAGAVGMDGAAGR